MQYHQLYDLQSVHERWTRIQQKDAFDALIHLQNQLRTTQESVSCFQSTLHGLTIDEAILFKIKNATFKVSLAMDEMRVCFQNLGSGPRLPDRAFNAPLNPAPLSPAPRLVAVPTIFQPIRVSFKPNVDRSDGRFNASQERADYQQRVYDRRRYAPKPAQICSAPTSSATVHQMRHCSGESEDSSASCEKNARPAKSESSFSYGYVDEFNEHRYNTSVDHVESENISTQGGSDIVPKSFPHSSTPLAAVSDLHEAVVEAPNQHSVSVGDASLGEAVHYPDRTIQTTLDQTSNPSPDGESQPVLEQEPETSLGGELEPHPNERLEDILACGDLISVEDENLSVAPPPGDAAECSLRSTIAPVSTDGATVESSATVPDQTSPPLSMCEVSNEDPESVPQKSTYQFANGVSEFLYDSDGIPVYSYEGPCEAPEYPIDQTCIPIPMSEGTDCPPEEMSIPIFTSGAACGAADLEAAEVLQERAEGTLSDEQQDPEFVADGSSAEYELQESSYYYPVEPATDHSSGLLPPSLAAMARGQLVESILSKAVENTVSDGRTPDVDQRRMPISIEEQNSGGGTAENVSGTVRKNSLGFPASSAPESEMASQTDYRSGRESSHSNGSHDGYCSPVLSEAKTICNSKVSPQRCEIDELAKSLEEHWSLSDPSLVFANEVSPIRCIPKSGIVPSRIEDFRMPPPLKYVRALLSHCTEESLYVQLMEDETAILKLDASIDQGAKTAPLKFSEVQPGDFVLCLYDLDQRFYRGQLLRAKGEDRFRVRFIDYGNESDTSVKNMRRLPDSARRLGQCALKCDLPQELRKKAELIKKQLESISLESHFLACFAATYTDRQLKAPIFTLLDIQTIDGTSILQVPAPISLESMSNKVLVRNLELGILGTRNIAKVDLVDDLRRKEAIAVLLESTPSLPCEGRRITIGSLVAYNSQRARVIQICPNSRVALELIDEFQKELSDVSLEDCSLLPLIAINVPPTAPCIVRLAKDQDMDMVGDLCGSEYDIEMTVVGVDVLPSVKFSRHLNGTAIG